MLDRAADVAGDDIAVAASLRFARGGGRTFLERQHVPYPFHVTRPHRLDPLRPDVATLILQSASGGLYRGDRLRLDIGAGRGARVHVTSQAATVVHRASAAIEIETRLTAEAEAVLVVTTDPYILFPGTRLSVLTVVTLDLQATAIVAEGFATHDPAGEHRPFGRLAARVRIERPGGIVLVDEGGTIDGAAFAGDASPLGPFRAMGSVMILGPGAAGLDAGAIEAALDRCGCLAGVTALPNGAGVCVRLLAAAGGPLARGLEHATAAAYEAAIGPPPAARRR